MIALDELRNIIKTCDEKTQTQLKLWMNKYIVIIGNKQFIDPRDEQNENFDAIHYLKEKQLHMLSAEIVKNDHLVFQEEECIPFYGHRNNMRVIKACILVLKSGAK